MVRLAGQCCSGATFGEIALWQEGKGHGDVVQDEGWMKLDKHHDTSDSTTVHLPAETSQCQGFVSVVRLLCFLNAFLIFLKCDIPSFVGGFSHPDTPGTLSLWGYSLLLSHTSDRGLSH